MAEFTTVDNGAVANEPVSVCERGKGGKPGGGLDGMLSIAAVLVFIVEFEKREDRSEKAKKSLVCFLRRNS